MTKCATPRPRGRKASLVDAATLLFAERGYAGVSIDDIGASVGISGPAVYRHFRSKDEVFHEVLLGAAESLACTLRRAGLCAISGVPVPSPEREARAAIRFAVERRAHLEVFLRQEWLIDIPAPVRSRLDEAKSEVASIIGQIVTGRVDNLSKDEITMRTEAFWGAVVSSTCPAVLSVPGLEMVPLGALLEMCAAPVAPSATPRRDGCGDHDWRPPESVASAIIRTAMNLFRHRGFAAVSMEEIADGVGLAGPSVYYYYSNKTEILLEAHLRARISSFTGWDKAVAAATDPAEALDLVLQHAAESLADYFDLIFVAAKEPYLVEDREGMRIRRARKELDEMWVQLTVAARPELDELSAQVLVNGVHGLLRQAVKTIQTTPERLPQAIALARAWMYGGKAA